MNILNEIKIGISKLLGVHEKAEISWSPKILKTKRIQKRGLGRPKGSKIPQSVVDAVRKANKSYNCQELADKYGVSHFWVWSVRNNKLRLNREIPVKDKAKPKR